MPQKHKGFTLLEVLVALFIFTIVAIIMTSALHNVFTIQASTEKHAERLTELQISLLLLSNDISQTIDRSIIDAKGTAAGPFIGTATSITFTHGGLANPQGKLLRSTLQRVNYHFENNALIRETWPVLDQVSKTVSNDRKLLGQIINLQFEFLDKKNVFHHSWPTEQTSAPDLPRAVRVTLTLENWGKISQLYIIEGHAFATPSL